MWSSADGRTGSAFSSGHSATEDRPRSGRSTRIGLTVALVLLSLSLWGCPIRWQRVSINDVVNPEDVAFIVPGQTTFRTIVEKLGAPDEILDSPVGPVARYRFRDLKYFRVNFGYAWKFFVPPGVPDDMVLAGGGVGTDEFLVVLDADWVVQRHAFAHHVEASQYRAWPFDPSAPSSSEDPLDDPGRAY